MQTDIAAPVGATNEFYVVSKQKFYLLFLLTLGIYMVYWSYKNWRLQKIATDADVYPVLRGLFLVFFMHGLYERVQAQLVRLGRSFEWSPANQATIVVALILASNILDRLGAKEIGSPYTDIAGIALLPFTAIVMWKGQAAINTSCGDPAGASNARYSGWNWLWMVLGGAFWLVIAVGMAAILFTPPE